MKSASSATDILGETFRRWSAEIAGTAGLLNYHNRGKAVSIMSADEDLERILQLAQRAKITDEACQSLQGDHFEAQIEAHGEAFDNLWAELYRQIENREAAGEPVHQPKMPPDPRKELKKEIIAALKAELPGMVSSIIDQF